MTESSDFVYDVARLLRACSLTGSEFADSFLKLWGGTLPTALLESLVQAGLGRAGGDLATAEAVLACVESLAATIGQRRLLCRAGAAAWLQSWEHTSLAQRAHRLRESIRLVT